MSSALIGSKKTIMVISHEGTDVAPLLDSLVADGTIAGWDDDSPLPLRSSVTGDYVTKCLLRELSLSPDNEETRKAEHFWEGAIDEDGSIAPAVLSVMRIDEAKRNAYIKRYKNMGRYVEEVTSVHADAVLLPDGSLVSNDGMRGCNQLHDWAVGFADRFIRPLADGGDGDDDLVARTMSYRTA